MVSRCLVIVGSLVLFGCGGGQAPAKTADAKSAPESDDQAQASSTQATEEPEEGEASSPAEAEAAGIPTQCGKQGDICTPPKAFVDRLCQGVYPNVALVMFRGGTPWTRAYLTRKTEAWNASGGASVAGYLEFDEEVLVLKHRGAPKGGMQVSGAGGGYEALRWNGACVTLAAEEVTLRQPPQPKYPRIEWKWIDDGLREALKEDKSVWDAYLAFRKECKGVTMGKVSKKCITADAKLGDEIVRYIVGGGELPVPEELPE